MSAQKITFSYITIVVLVAVVLLMTATRVQSGIPIDPTAVATAQPDIHEEGFFYTLSPGGRVPYYSDFHDQCTVVFSGLSNKNDLTVYCRGMIPGKVHLGTGEVFGETNMAPRMAGLYYGAVTVRSETKLLRHVMYLPQLANERIQK